MTPPPPEAIRGGLERAGSPCWMAPRDIAPGLDYGTQIIDAIEACTVLVLVLSENSNYSIFVRKEVERAIAKGKVVIPVRIQDVTASRSLEFFISDGAVDRRLGVLIRLGHCDSACRRGRPCAPSSPGRRT